MVDLSFAFQWRLSMVGDFDFGLEVYSVYGDLHR